LCSDKNSFFIDNNNNNINTNNIIIIIIGIITALLRLVKIFSNQYPSQYQNANDLPDKLSPVDFYGMDFVF
jgi:hypothetical protein